MKRGLSCQLTNAWIRWRKRMLDRPGAPKRIVRVCWKHLAEAPVFLGDLQLPPLTELQQHSAGGWETQLRLDYVQHQHTWFKAVVLTVYTYLGLIHPLTPSHVPNRPPLKWGVLPISLFSAPCPGRSSADGGASVIRVSWACNTSSYFPQCCIDTGCCTIIRQWIVPYFFL